MSDSGKKTPPPDQAERERALDAGWSVLVQAPAGSGKTDLLTRRFLCLLAEVDEPGQIVAITFTKAAAAEMRHRILAKLEETAARGDGAEDCGAFSMETLAGRALARSRAMGWNLLELPAQLRISTIDAFCRELALQQPLLSGLGDGLGIYEQPEELYRRAARRTIEQMDSADRELGEAIRGLLLWRDNNWQEMESLLVEMLANRDRWMHDFVLDREQDWEVLRARLERPFAKAAGTALGRAGRLLDQVPEARAEAFALARFACGQEGGAQFQPLAELAEFPAGDFWGFSNEQLEAACEAHAVLANLLLTDGGTFRKSVDKRLGFPADRKAEKARLAGLIAQLREVAGLESALGRVRELPPARYTDDDWRILRACFTLLRRAAAELRVVFAEAGAVDYVEVAQIAQSVLKAPDGTPSDAAIVLADKIRHILVDEFQDTSRRQHELLRRLIAAWPEREGRSCFVVGDPMQSIYFFRDADAELFPRVKTAGLEIPGTEPLTFDPVALKSNFRAVKPLVERLNEVFEAVFATDDGSGVRFSAAEPARNGEESGDPHLKINLKFSPQLARKNNDDSNRNNAEAAKQSGQAEEIVALIKSYGERIAEAKASKETFRVAVLGRTRAVLAPVAQALREASIPFRAVDLEKLAMRPEVLDALALARALLNPLDRVAWLGVLRAPWCGLPLRDLHTLASADDRGLMERPLPELLAERAALLSPQGRLAVGRMLDALQAAPGVRFGQPAAAVGTRLEQIWLRLGGAACVDRAGRANLDLLWQCLDKLPDGELDLAGPALEAALEKLTAQPDPEADSECGVQLMTIHKSKGLEFEVVIVPGLEAGSRNGAFKMLSWLERGLAPEDAAGETDEVTEFLVAPFQPKGAERGSAKAWVDRVYRERESQEMRRLLYVAATRAREELHLFAQLACKQDKKGEWMLAEPSGSLLATAWPALKAEAEQHFEAWKAAIAETETGVATIETIAAAGDDKVIEMPKAARLRRLPVDYRPRYAAEGYAHEPGVVGMNADLLYQRHEGGLLSRALGVAVHTLLEELARVRQTQEWDAARAALAKFAPRIVAQVRTVGVEPQRAERIAARAEEIALEASHDVIGQWILSPHPDAMSEARWAGVVGGEVRTVQADRVFRAGDAPETEGGEWWIVDYKTAHADALDPAEALPQLRTIFAPQLAAYAEVLRKLHGDTTTVRAGLYYPRMGAFDWWEI